MKEFWKEFHRGLPLGIVGGLIAVALFLLFNPCPPCPDPDVAYRLGVTQGWEAGVRHTMQRIYAMATVAPDSILFEKAYWDSVENRLVDSVLNLSP